ncbi:MAG: pullulanase-type alpha-1,6-glucosidase [Anaerolineae bacterium]
MTDEDRLVATDSAVSPNGQGQELEAPEETAPPGNLTERRAYWLAWDTIAWNLPQPGPAAVRLYYAPDGGLTLTADGIEGGDFIVLAYEQNGLDTTIKARFPHLRDHAAYRIRASDILKVTAILRGQMAVAAFDDTDGLLDATSLQIAGVLDDLYTYYGELGIIYNGATPSLKVWAPTARDVSLHLFETSTAPLGEILPMRLDPAIGVWSIEGDPSWTGRYYLYEVEVWTPTAQRIERNLVTDPYSISLSIDGTRSQIVDLGDAALQPPGWSNMHKPRLNGLEDIVIYELHVRDFSANDPSVPEPYRGTYKAFTLGESHGMRHLCDLAKLGLTHIHLLPVFDISTIEEDCARRHDPDPAVLASFAPDSPEQQALVGATRHSDSYNWGYDPFHYTTPEGSYAAQPEGGARILEFREMVMALSEAGLRVVMDVVYNHTSASGQNPNSVLDKVVPGYYHRLNAIGHVEMSTCCDNTASEHAMMEKLMVDSLVTWATAYKIDGFRFDLMGHHMRANLLKARDTLRTLTPERHGVDGSKIYIYGEGWDFGEVGWNARGVNASQGNMAGTGIGTFSDRLRDAARGGSGFGDPREQGFVTGLWYEPNGHWQGREENLRSHLLYLTDLIRLGLAGNLADYEMVTSWGAHLRGDRIDYNGQPAGYAREPYETVTYLEAHDNETLFDAIQMKSAHGVSIADRVRMHNLGVSLVMLGQGIPFFQAGQDLLRSKSLDRNSYDSGDWFNRIDWTRQANNWGVGLPPAWDNEHNWPLAAPLLADPMLCPGPTEIAAAHQHFREMLRIRKSSKLFRLGQAAEIRRRVSFLNTGQAQSPALIAMHLDGSGLPEDIAPHQNIVVVFNAAPYWQHATLEWHDKPMFSLHPLQTESADPVVREAHYDGGAFVVPPRTTAVFVSLW